MKRILALTLVTMLLVFLASHVVYASAVSDPAPTPVEEVVFAAPVIEEATLAPVEADPGGVLPIDLTELFQAVWSVLALIVVRYLIPWVRSKIKAERLAAFDYWSTVAVAAAEKAYGSGKGYQKLELATEIMRSHGFTIDTDVVDALIKQLFETDLTYKCNDPVEVTEK